MAASLIDRLTNFFMPMEDDVLSEYRDTPLREVQDNAAEEFRERQNQARLRPVSGTKNAANLKVLIHTPLKFDDVRSYADYLQVGVALVLNYQQVEPEVQQRISDFLNGVCYVQGGVVQRISDCIAMYLPKGVGVDKELSGYSIPTYGQKQKN